MDFRGSRGICVDYSFIATLVRIWCNPDLIEEDFEACSFFAVEFETIYVKLVGSGSCRINILKIHL